MSGSTGVNGGGVPFQAITHGQVLQLLTQKNRVALIGDSVAQRASSLMNLPTTTGSFVVSGGIGTLTFSANVGIMSGNYFVLNNVSDAGLSHPDNGVAFQCIAGSNAVTFGKTVTFASNAAAGDYSNYAGGFWAANWHTSNFDMGLFTVLNAYARQQYLVTLNYGAVGELSANTLAKIPRILTGPPFDIAYLACDAINDAQTYLGAITAAVTAANNYINCIQQLQAAGKQVIIQTSNAIRVSTGGGFQGNNLFLMVVRKLVLEYCKSNNQVTVYDTFKETIVGGFSGTTDGYVATNAIGSFVASADVHMNPNGYYVTARNETYLQQGSIGYPLIENALVSVLDDATAFSQAANPYRNLQASGGMAGVGGTLVGGATGSAATNWTLTATGGAVCVGTGGYTPTQIGNTNSENYAFAQRIQLTASGSGQGFTFKGPFNPAITSGWYQIGFRVYNESLTSGLGAVYGSYNLGPGNIYLQSSGQVDVGFQLLAADALWLASGPIYFDRAPSIGQLFITGGASGAGSFSLQASAAFCRPLVNNPYQ
jgi:hypothetical protein